MKLALFSSILCIILGIGIVVGGAIAYIPVNSALNDLESTAVSYLAKADNALLSAQQAINSTQSGLRILGSDVNLSLPSLTVSGELTRNIANNLTTIGSTVDEAGETLSSISIGNINPFDSVGNAISSVGQPIAEAGNSLGEISDGIDSIGNQAADVVQKIDDINAQLDDVGGSLADLRVSVVEAKDSLSTYFGQIRLAATLAILAVIGLGIIFLMIGISLFSLRRKTLHLQRQVQALLQLTSKKTT